MLASEILVNMTVIQPVQIHKLPDLEFNVLRETWAKYKLSDGAILYLRGILVKLFLIGMRGKYPNFAIGRQTILAVRSNERKNPKPPEKPLNELSDEIKEDVEIDKVLEEEWNSYEVIIKGERYIVEIKPVVTMIKKVRGYYDQAGYPIYEVSHDIITRVRREK